jgi:hypothetical protein
MERRVGVVGAKAALAVVEQPPLDFLRGWIGEG